MECVAEIERRGLEEVSSAPPCRSADIEPIPRRASCSACVQRGLYRVPGGERLVKELRDRAHQGKTPVLLSKVHDIHVVCGLLKDSLRRLKEPLITFRLHRTFMEASGRTRSCCSSVRHIGISDATGGAVDLSRFNGNVELEKSFSLC